MKKTVKAGILIGILVVPALSFLFLQFFAKNQFDIPYFFPELDELGEVVVIEGDTVFSQVTPFVLTNEQNEEFSFENGKITVVNFFFTRCGTICPIMNSNLAHSAELFKNESKVRFLGISVDPNFDTPEVLRDYARSLRIDEFNYHLLTGDKSYIYNLCLKTFKLPVADASEYDPEINDIDEQFIHSEKILLIDTEGYFRGIYDGTIAEDVDRLRAEIKVLLSQLDD